MCVFSCVKHVTIWHTMYIVELEGVEPSSKRGSNLLSTCLASFWLSGRSATEATILHPYLLNFGKAPKPRLSYLRFTCTTWSERFEATASGWCLVLPPGGGIKRLIYYTSITQQERNCYCQLIVWRLRLKCKPTTHCMLTNLFYPLSKPVNPIFHVSHWYLKRNGISLNRWITHQ